MNNTIKKAAAVFAAAMTILSTSAVSAFAKNNSDTPWSGGNNYYRVKEDTSCVYVYNKSKNKASVSVFGSNYCGGVNYAVETCSGYKSTYATIGLSIPAGSKRQIHQFIREKGYRYAHVYFYGNTSGVWSPDQAGSYTNAN